MFAAVNARDPEIVSILLKAGGSVNERTASGSTPLMLAARFNDNPEIVSALLAAGADLSARDSFGKTAVDYAKGNQKMLGALQKEMPRTVR